MKNYAFLLFVLSFWMPTFAQNGSGQAMLDILKNIPEKPSLAALLEMTDDSGTDVLQEVRKMEKGLPIEEDVLGLSASEELFALGKVQVGGWSILLLSATNSVTQIKVLRLVSIDAAGVVSGYLTVSGNVAGRSELMNITFGGGDFNGLVVHTETILQHDSVSSSKSYLFDFSTGKFEEKR